MRESIGSASVWRLLHKITIGQSALSDAIRLGEDTTPIEIAAYQNNRIN